MRPPSPSNSNRQLLMSAVGHHQKGELVQAEPIYRQILKSEPRNPDALHLLGLLEHQRGNNDAGRSLMEKALMIKPGEPTFLVNLSQVHRATGRLSEAEQCLRRAIAAQPRLVEAYSNLASVLRMQKRLDEAEAAAKQALSLNPGFGNAMLTMGTILDDRGMYEQAIPWFTRALQHGASRADVLNNLGDAYCCLGRFAEGKQALEEAVKVAPDMALAHWNLSLLYLLQGDLSRGFAEQEWRLKHGKSDTLWFGKPMWRGEPLDNKTLLLHMEQGFGDAIQFIRYAPLVKQLGGRVIVECREEVADLLATVSGVDEVIPRGKPLPPFDVHAPLLSLGHLFKTTLDSIPNNVPYLRADPSRVVQWQGRLNAPIGMRKIGLVWAGNPNHRNDRNRSIAAEQLGPLAGVTNAKWFCLQKGLPANYALPAGLELTDLSADIHDFTDTAAAVSALDLLITVDTAPAHLAGALGRPAWILLPYVPDWRWLLGREDSPWYPTARLFRQTRRGAWGEVIQRVIQELGR